MSSISKQPDSGNKIDKLLAFHNRILANALQLFHRSREVDEIKREQINRRDELEAIRRSHQLVESTSGESIQPSSLQTQPDPFYEVPCPTPPSPTPIDQKDEVLIESNSPKSETQQFKGVIFEPDKHDGKPWRAHIDFMGRDELIGDFKSAEEAAKAYNKMALLYYGKKAELNNV